ncbi:MAG: DedA family protein [Saccharospirillaceae bacterium]|nr:DedA family protein [Pseudomonadales bacterium]NRB79895.1 DedA family protein [Saccharospirillaceae bacterium]
MESILNFLGEYPALLCVAIVLSAFSETIIGVGMFVPSFIMMAALTSTAAMVGIPFIWVIISAFSGAYAGDSLGFFVGRYFSDSIQHSAFFVKRKKWFNKVQHQYENKGLFFIVIARFFGPLRCIVPFVSGSLKIHPRLFLPLAFFAVLVWAPFYTLPGYVAGKTEQWLSKDEINAYILNINVLVLLLSLFAIWLMYFLSFMLVNRMEKWYVEESKTPRYRPVIFSLVTFIIVWALNSSNSQLTNVHITNWFVQLPFSQTGLILQTNVLWLLLFTSTIWLSILRAFVGAGILVLTMLGLWLSAIIEPVYWIQLLATNIWLLVLITCTTKYNNPAFRRSMMALACITLFMLGAIAVMEQKIAFFLMLIILLVSLWINHLHRFIKLTIGRGQVDVKLPRMAHLIVLLWLCFGLISGYL